MLILFGDHSPSMGENAIGMTMCGINANLSTLEGAVNTYETPYIIWANPAARELLQKPMTGQGPTMDPQFLMPEVFKQLGWRGSKYTAFSQDFMKNVTVTKPFLWYEKGRFSDTLSKEEQKKFKELLDYEYYVSHEKVDE